MVRRFSAPVATQKFHADTHYNFQIMVVLSGVQEVVYSEYRTTLAGGQLWWASCWEPHASRAARAHTDTVVITLSPELLGSASPFRDVNWLAPFFTPPADRPQARTRAARQKVLALARAILNLMQRQPPGWRTLQWLKIHELLVFLMAGWQPPNMPDRAPRHEDNVALLLPALQRIMDEPNAPATLNGAAKMCGLSRSHFSALFSRTMGTSFKQYALNVRLACASRLLRTTRLPVKTVAQRCGFMNLSHFYHVFFKHFQITPVTFQKQAATIEESWPGILPREKTDEDSVC